MKIDFTKDEAQFLFENIAKISVPITNPNAGLIAGTGHTCLLKLQAALTGEQIKIAEAQPGDVIET